MKYTLFALALLCAPVFGGKLIEMESVNLSNNQVSPRRMMVDNDRFAMVDARSKVIFRADGGRSRMLVVDLQRNEYMEIDEATMKQLADTMAGVTAQMEAAMKGMDAQTKAMMAQMMKGKMAAAAGPSVAPVTFARDGNETVAGYPCTRYTGTQNGATAMEVCASSAAALKLAAGEYAVFEKMREFSKSLMQGVQNSPIGGMASSALTTPGYDGFPVEQTAYNNGRAATKDTLKSIAEQSFSEADFSTGSAKKTDPFARMKGKGR